ncbi:MAG: nucleoside triphosphate pyrophosphohydrolase [Gloeomargarita sp. SKYBB_i_bin120]|nr:nucleoside triphosphate pyrophosphohydrolase [Gloeomargarita sp. SKYB120]MDW8178347.1 nucleoside triphosphate pyrophosphohydrolase [Gloeomargarita sp. SKYBB_i_bin120]
MTTPRVYNKLIRDKIPDILRQSGKKFAIREMNQVEFRQALRDKLCEEAEELRVANFEALIDELADIYEVIDTLLQVYGITEADVRDHQRRKRLERGGFDQRMSLLWVE